MLGRAAAEVREQAGIEGRSDDLDDCEFAGVVVAWVEEIVRGAGKDGRRDSGKGGRRGGEPLVAEGATDRKVGLPGGGGGWIDGVDGQVIGSRDFEEGVGVRQLVPLEFQMDENFEERACGGLRKVDDGSAGVVPASRGAKAAFSGEGLVIADAPERAH